MGVTNLTNDQLQQLRDSEPGVLLLDVRSPEEFYTLGHIPGAMLMPIHELVANLGALDPQRKTIVICEHGIRSHDASHYLAYHGFQQVYQLTAGMAEWNGPRAYTSDTELPSGSSTSDEAMP
jgi:rhodanese-related sulfurtransferase